MSPRSQRPDVNRYGAAGAVLLVVGAVLVAGGVYFTLQQERQVGDFQRTNGTVLSTGVESVDGGYVPNVTYRYSVDGTNYTSASVFPGERRPSERDHAREVAGRYDAGERVTVYYPEGDPAAPSLRAPRSPTPVFAFGFGLVAIAFGFLLAVAGRQGGMDPITKDEVTLPGSDAEKRDEEDA